MKIILTILITVINVFGQAPGKEWEKQFNFNIRYILEDNSYNIALLGDSNFTLVDTVGDSIWQNNIGGKTMIINTDGNYVLIGESLYCCDSDGKVLWQKPVAGNRITQDNSDYYLVLNSDDSTITKLDSMGVDVWNKKYPWHIADIVKGYDEGFAVTGQILVAENDPNMLLAKMDTYGDIVWEKYFDNNPDDPYQGDHDKGKSIVQNGVGGYLAFGNDAINAWYLNIDSNGVLIWESIINPRSTSCEFTFYNNLITRTNNNEFISIFSRREACWMTGFYYIYIYSINANGVLLWEKFINQEKGYSNIIQSSLDGGYYYAVGNTLYKLEKDSVNITINNNGGNTLSGAECFLQNKHNSYMLNIWLDEFSYIKVNLFNLRGENVLSSGGNYVKRGSYNIIIPLEKLPYSKYILELRINDQCKLMEIN